jgi:hypothetical protein
MYKIAFLFQLFNFVTFFNNASGFAFSKFSSTKPIVNNFNYVGDIQPVGYFDPLQISENIDQSMIKYLREAELQHARVAMYSMVVLPFLDLTDKHDLAINKLASMSFEEQLPFWIGAGAYECSRMGAGWKNCFIEDNAFFELEDDYQPGNVYKVPSTMYTGDRLNKELANGRLAMIGALGYIAQEVVTGQSVFA